LRTEFVSVCDPSILKRASFRSCENDDVMMT
jgi:hypothetical protein